MTSHAVAGFCIIAGAELLALLLPDRRFVLLAAGVALTVALVVVHRFLMRDIDPGPGDDRFSDPGESLRRWLSRTETLISWSESSRRDWDRHLRPLLARQFEMATGHKQSKDPAAFLATGQMLFGEQLWQWVDPQNVARTGGQEPAPGRAALSEILQCLEQV